MADDSRPKSDQSFASFNLSHAFAQPIPNNCPQAPSPPSDEDIAHVQHIQNLLAKRPGPEYISSRPGAGGSKFFYIEGWKVIELANEIFGFNGWSTETKAIDVDYVDQNADGKYNVGVSAIVRIRLKDGSSHEDVGYGRIENSPTKGDALEKCKKEAVTDALKRSMRAFGNLLGNCLYDKNYLGNIKNMSAQKEKFLPSKLHRPEYANKTSSTDIKPNTSEIPGRSANVAPDPAPVAQQVNKKPSINNIKQCMPPPPPVKTEPNHKRVDTFPPPPRKLCPPQERVSELSTTNARPVLDQVASDYSSTPSDHLLDFDESELAQLDANEQSMIHDQDLNEMTVEDNSLTTEPSIIHTAIQEDSAPQALQMQIRRSFDGQSASSKLDAVRNRPTANNTPSHNILDRSLTRPYQAGSKPMPPRAATTNYQKAFVEGPSKGAAPVPQAGQLPGLRGSAASALAANGNSRRSFGNNGVENQPLNDTRGLKRPLDRTRETPAVTSNQAPSVRADLQLGRSMNTTANQVVTNAQTSKFVSRPQQQYPYAPARPLPIESCQKTMAQQDHNIAKKAKT